MIWFSKSKFSSNRTLKNVYLRQCEELQKRVEFFQKRRDWYDSKGIPHTLGIVMWGHPGCGKTSTIKAIANDTKRHIFNIMLSEIKTKEALKNLFYNDTVPIFGGERLETYHIPINKRIYVIEDIDAMDSIVLKRTTEQIKKEEEKRLKREAEMELLKQQQGQEIYNRMVQGSGDDKTDALDLATLLNVLDGVRETPGRIIILSTNYPERLDEALLRPGRFDMMIEYEKHPIEILKEHLQKYYDTTLTVKQDRLLSNPALDKKWTPAEVSQILFKYLYTFRVT
jgi:SpoVK/Ycf46/Vps4 family AAA+-type ATPase